MPLNLKVDVPRCEINVPFPRGSLSMFMTTLHGEGVQDMFPLVVVGGTGDVFSLGMGRDLRNVV